MLFLLFAVFSLGFVRADDDDFLTTLSEQSSLTKFTSLIRNHSSLVTAVQAGAMTVLAPTDAAFDTFFSTATSTTNYSSYDEIEALLSYHLLRGVHSQASISSIPMFVPTLLTNSSYSNVTGGQVVEMVSNNSITVFGSAVNQVAKLDGPEYDILYLGGLIHIIDGVLIPPLTPFDTFNKAPLPYFIDLLSPSVLNGQYNEVLHNITNMADVTAFTANDPSLLAITQSNVTATKQGVSNLIKYSVIIGQVLYSPSLTNGSSLATAAGVNVTITVFNGSTYVNDAKITRTDILVSNGVLHVIDRFLNVSNPNARPQTNIPVSTASPVPPASTAPIASPAPHSGGLSRGAKAGIGIGVALGALAIIGIFFLVVWKYRAKSNPATVISELDINPVQSTGEIGMSPIQNTAEIGMFPADRQELDAKVCPPQELDATVWNQEPNGQNQEPNVQRKDIVIDGGIERGR